MKKRSSGLISTAWIGLAMPVLLGGLIGCSAPVDNTMNKLDPTSSADPNYPAGPYGYIEGSTVENYKFLGKTPTNGDYVSLAMRDLLLGEFHADPSLKLLLLEGSANWCYYCNEEAPKVEQLSVDKAAQGFRALTVLAEGNVQGVPSTADDINSWVSDPAHIIKKTAMAIDPEGRLFQYAPASAFPVHILLDTATMKIKWLCVGGIGACDTEGSVNDALSAL